MAYRNQRGQVLIESVFLLLLVVSLLIGFQIMIDQQKTAAKDYRLSKFKRNNVYDKKNVTDFNTKK